MTYKQYVLSVKKKRVQRTCDMKAAAASDSFRVSNSEEYNSVIT